MKERELRKYLTCSVCRKPIGAAGLPLFFRVTLERFGVDVKVTRRQDALGDFIGSSRIAEVMGPNEDMTQTLMEKLTLSICEACAIAGDRPIHFLAELKGIET